MDERHGDELQIRRGLLAERSDDLQISLENDEDEGAHSHVEDDYLQSIVVDDPRVREVLRSATPTLRRKLAAIHEADPPLSNLILQSLPGGSMYLLSELFDVVTEEETPDGGSRLSLTQLGEKVAQAAAELTLNTGSEGARRARVRAARPAAYQRAREIAERYGLQPPPPLTDIPDPNSAEAAAAGRTRLPAPNSSEGPVMTAIGVHIRPDTIVATTTSGLEKPAVYSLLSDQPEEVIDQTCSIVRDLIDGHSRQVGDQELGEVVRVGLALGGHVDSRAGAAIKLARYHVRLESPHLAETLENATGVATIVENDANALALHEYIHGDARGAACAATVIMGAGIGAGVIQDRRLIRGHSGMAGEIGHSVVEPGGRECLCGEKGCLESVAGTDSIAEILSEMADQDVGGFAEALKLRRENNKHAEVTFERAALGLGRALGDLLNLYDPSKVVLYGPPGLVEDESIAEPFMSTVWDVATDQVFSDSGVARQLVVKPLKDATIARAAGTTAVHRHFENN